MPDGVFKCKYCKEDVRWLDSGNKGILVNAKKISVLVPVVKSAGTIVGSDMSLLDEITYCGVEAFKKHFCSKPVAVKPPSQGAEHVV